MGALKFLLSLFKLEFSWFNMIVLNCIVMTIIELGKENYIAVSMIVMLLIQTISCELKDLLLSEYKDLTTEYGVLLDKYHKLVRGLVKG